MDWDINDLYDVADAIIDITDKADYMSTAINEYYKALESNDNEGIEKARIKIMGTFFEFGGYIPDSCGGYMWDTYKDVFNMSTQLMEKEAERERIKGLMESAAINAGNSELVDYYAAILQNFDEYYAKKMVIKQALEAEKPQTAIATIYEIFIECISQIVVNPVTEKLDKLTDWLMEKYPDLGPKCVEIGEGISDFFNWIFNNNIKKVKNSVNIARITNYDPLILDLDGDGYNIETKKNGANFDLDKNGFAERINWTSRDGFLCLDLNGNGTIDNGGELFGDQTLLADGTRAKNGFEALARHDSNGDGIIDADDEIFDSLRIWVDADGSGTTDEGELKTLAELGIVSINLGYDNVNDETGTEAMIGNSATFTREDGTTGGVGELWVSSDLYDTVDNVSVEIPDDIKELPNVCSIGNVYSLHNAMALDETGELKALVESFASEEDVDKRMAIAEQILFFISGANDIEADSRGEYIDARQLAVIEAMFGENYVGTTGPNPHSDAAPMLRSAYQDLLNMYYNELNAQTFIKGYVSLLGYTEDEDGTKTLNADLLNYILEYQLENGDENTKKMLTEIARYVQYLDNGGINGINSFVMNYAVISAEYAAEIVKIMPDGYAADGDNPLNGTNSVDFLVGSDNDDELYGYSGNDTLIGGKGNDTLYGGAGNDTYVFNLGDGNDVINEQDSNSANDRVVFGEGISAEDIIVTRIGNDMVLKIKDTDDSLKIVSQYNDSWYWVENFEFADGTVLNVNDLLNTSLTISGSGEFGDFTDGYGTRDTTLIGSDESDSIYGYSGNDTLIGGKGNDTLYGGAGNDTYVFNLGDGNDVIDEQDSNSANDRIVFGEGISAEDIIVTRIGNDMVLKIKDTEDSLRIVSQYGDSWYWVENFEFADGTVLNVYDLLNTSLTISGSGEFGDFTDGYGTIDNMLIGSDESDSIYGYIGNDILIGGKGDDNLYGGTENDTYVFNLGDGNDVIDEQDSNSANDRIVFGEGISAEDIIVTRIGNDMVLKIKDTDDSLRIVSQYGDSWYWVENFEFADGTVLTVYDLLNTSLTISGSGEFGDFTDGYGTRDTTLIGSDESDSIYGYLGNDTLIGGKGNDTLYGGEGNDTYVFNIGDGNDVIDEQDANSENDKIVFGEGISAENIIFQNIDGNMVISFVGSDDTITITNQFSDSWYRIENFCLSDGTTIDYSQINLLIQSMAAFEADTGMTWAEAAEQPTEEYSDIISQMWVKTA